jgi:hypothetical protein
MAPGRGTDSAPSLGTRLRTAVAVVLVLSAIGGVASASVACAMALTGVLAWDGVPSLALQGAVLGVCLALCVLCYLIVKWVMPFGCPRTLRLWVPRLAFAVAAGAVTWVTHMWGR